MYDAPNLPDQATAETEPLFKQKTIDRAAVIESEYAGPGKWKKHTEEEDVEEASAITKNATTYNVNNWKQDLPVPKEFYDDDQHDMVEAAVQDMGRQARNSRDEDSFGIYVKGFDTTTTPDAAYLWSDSHTNLNGDTIDNLETGAFNANNFETLWRKLAEMKDQRGRLGGHNPAALLVPPVLFPDAQETLKSELRPYTTDNQLNWISQIYPGLAIFESPWVGSTYASYSNAQTAHYLVAKNHKITRRVRETLNTTLVDWQYDKKDRYQYKGRFREVTYAGSWEGAVASTGAA